MRTMGGVMRLTDWFSQSDSVVVLIDPRDSAIVEVNAAFEAALGCRAADVIGRLPLDLGLWADPNDRTRLWEQIRRSRRAVDLPIRLRAADGRTLVGTMYCELVGSGERRGLLCLSSNLRAEDGAPPGLAAADGYRQLFLTAAEGIYRRLPGGGFIDANPAMAGILGLESMEAVLHDYGAQAPEIYDQPGRNEQLAQILARQGLFDGEISRIRRADGSVAWIRESARAVRDAAGEMLFREGTMIDITHQVQMEQALRHSENMYRILVEHSHDGVYLIQHGRVLFANPAMGRILDVPSQELVGRDYMSLIVPEDRDAQSVRRREREQGSQSTQRYEIRLLRRDGSQVLCEVLAEAIEYEGEIASAGVIRDITAQRAAEQRLRYLASHDGLTGLFNRSAFEQQLAEVIAQSHRDARWDYALLVLDLDGFKWVNDSLGHGMGDALLVRIGRALRVAVGGEVSLARYGGDEFTAIAKSPCSQEQAQALGERILAIFAQPFEVAGQKIYSGASIGIAMGRSSYHYPEQVMRDADTAMYRAKTLGKPVPAIFDDAMHAQVRDRFVLETDMRLALDRDEFRVFYQPIVRIEDGGIVGCEALVRWQHPRRGLLFPDEFLPVAEETGLIVELDAWVMRSACAQLAQWRRELAGCAQLTVNINMDERQFLAAGIAGQVAQVLDENLLPAQALRLEITETVFRSGFGHASAALNELKRLGVALVLDDFGTGYSSLEALAGSPFDGLKIDHGFVRDIVSNPRHQAIVRTIMRFAEDLDFRTTAEGVETPAQRQLLVNMGCPHVQGFLYSPAVPADSMRAMLSSSMPLGH